jgi:HK97 family phage major capsid protein
MNAVRSVLLNGRTTSDSILFVKENVYTSAAAAVAEAVSTVTGAKPESSLTFTQASAPVEVIAHWIPITRQALDDVPQLQSYVEGRLLDGLVREENEQLLKGDGTSPNISGILDQSGIQVLDQTYFTGAAVQNPGAGGPENFNRILRAKTLIMTTGDSMATFIIMNPTDYETLVTLADTTDNYFGAGPFSNGGLPNIWGLTPVLTEDMVAGNYLVGDGTAAQVWDRWDARILVADQHSDFFIRNMLVLLAEERLGLTVYRPAAFALVDVV